MTGMYGLIFNKILWCKLDEFIVYLHNIASIVQYRNGVLVVHDPYFDDKLKLCY